MLLAGIQRLLVPVSHGGQLAQRGASTWWS